MFVSKSTGSPSLNLPRDPNFNSTVLLVHGDSTTGANNTLYVDSSGLETYIPFKGTYSNYFNGSTDYLTVSPNTTIGTNDFTAEAWVYLTVNQASTIYDAGQFWFQLQSASQIKLTQAGVVDIMLYNTPTTLLNSWNHVAISRTGTSLRMFYNGNLVNTATNSTNFTTGFTRIGIESNSLVNPFAGYISNLRVVNGIGLYSSSFTPSTTPLTYVPGTVTLTCQSSRFIDNGLNNTITSTGNTAISSGGPAVVPAGKPGQGVFSPFATTGWSNYFNGSTDYLTITNSANLNPGTGDFTVEFWVYFNSVTANASLFRGQDNGIDVFVSSSSFAVGQAGVSTIIVDSASISVGQWYHIAVVRSGTSLVMYKNGTNVASATNSTNFVSSTTNIIGRNGTGGAAYFNGYISNLRVIKGTALYTSNFTSPTSSLTAVSGTQLLTSQDNRFKDNSTNAFTITSSGSPQVQPYSPFAPTRAYSKDRVSGSVYFNGSSNYLTVPSNTGFAFGTGDYTVECWIYPLDTTSGRRIVEFSDNNDNLDLNIAGAGYISYYNGSTSTSSSSAVVKLNAWNHIASVRSSGTVKVYVNGTVAVTQSTTPNTASARALNIAGVTNVWFNGYISNFRVLKGTALYTSNFTPPTTPLTPIGNTVLLINSTNAGIIDQTGKINLATYGAAAISSTQSVFGGSSIFFNGTTDYIATPYINSKYYDWATTGAYTIEAWIYPTSFANYKPIISNSLIGGGSNWELVLNNSGQVVWRYWTGSAQTYTTTSALTLNAWNHVALVLSGGNIIIYINGVSGVSSAYVATAAAGGGTDGTFIYIGAAYGGITGAATNYFAGYIDDFRITRGVARYTANFTPPARKFEDR